MSVFVKLAKLIRDNRGRTVLTVILVTYAAYVLWEAQHGHLFIDKSSKALSPFGIAHVCFWAFGPPVYFFFEYHIEPDVNERKKIKDSQDLASKVWAAVLVVLAVALTR